MLSGLRRESAITPTPSAIVVVTCAASASAASPSPCGVSFTQNES